MSEQDKIVLEEQQDRTVDLVLIGKYFLSKWWLILISGVILMIGAFIGTKVLVQETYQSSFTAYINNRTSESDLYGVTGADISASRQLASTYTEIIKSAKVLEKALKKSELTETFGYVKNSVSAGTVNGTEIIKVKVTLDDPQKAYQFAAALQEVTTEQISEIIEGSSVKILADAFYPSGRYSPNYTRNSLAGFMAGCALMLLILLIINLVDNRVKSSEEIAERYGMIILGMVHDMSQMNDSDYGIYGQRK